MMHGQKNIKIQEHVLKVPVMFVLQKLLLQGRNVYFFA